MHGEIWVVSAVSHTIFSFYPGRRSLWDPELLLAQLMWEIDHLHMHIQTCIEPHMLIRHSRCGTLKLNHLDFHYTAAAAAWNPLELVIVDEGQKLIQIG